MMMRQAAADVATPVAAIRFHDEERACQDYYDRLYDTSRAWRYRYSGCIC